MFISFEGGEGSGKSTQALILAEFLRSTGYSVVSTREPGGTEFAEAIRALLLSGAGVSDPLSELLLITAARRDHVMNLITPSLADGKIVICDRFIDSSLVYQGFVKGLPLELILKVTELTIGALTPDITILLDITPSIAGNRRESTERDINHYDSKDLSFHNKIRDGYLAVARLFPERIALIDASASRDVVATAVRDTVSRALKSHIKGT